MATLQLEKPRRHALGGSTKLWLMLGPDAAVGSLNALRPALWLSMSSLHVSYWWLAL